MATIDELNDMPSGPERLRAAHRTATDAAAKAKPARDALATAAWVLHYRHGWSRSKAAKDTGLFTTSIFPHSVVVELTDEEILARLPTFSLEEALEERDKNAREFRRLKAIEEAARDIRRKDVAALYQGHYDGRQWEMVDIAAAAGGMDMSIVKSDLKASGVEVRPGQKRKVANIEGSPEDLGPIARMLGVSRLYLKALVRYWRDPARADDPKAFPADAIAEDGKYWPGKVAAWFRSMPTVAASPTGLTIARAAERVGEPYETVKAAIDSAAEDGTLPADIVYSNGAVHEGRFTAWWRARKEYLHAGESLSALAEALGVDYKNLRTTVRSFEQVGELPEGVKIGERYDKVRFIEWWRAISAAPAEGVTMKVLAEALGVSPDKVRYQVRKAEQAGTLPPGVRLGNGRFHYERARTWWQSLSR